MEPRPAEPVILDYARREAPTAMAVSWPLCALLLLGIGAFIAPLQSPPDWIPSPVAMLLDVLDDFVVGRWRSLDERLIVRTSLALSLASALPPLLLAALPGCLPKLATPAAIVAIVLGALAMPGAPLFWSRGSWAGEEPALLVSLGLFIVGTGLAIYALIRRRGLYRIAWLTLATPHLAILGLLPCLREIHDRPGLGFWLYLAYAPVVVVQTVRVMMARPGAN